MWNLPFFAVSPLSFSFRAVLLLPRAVAVLAAMTAAAATIRPCRCRAGLLRWAAAGSGWSHRRHGLPALLRCLAQAQACPQLRLGHPCLACGATSPAAAGTQSPPRTPTRHPWVLRLLLHHRSTGALSHRRGFRRRRSCSVHLPQLLLWTPRPQVPLLLSLFRSPHRLQVGAAAAAYRSLCRGRRSCS